MGKRTNNLYYLNNLRKRLSRKKKRRDEKEKGNKVLRGLRQAKRENGGGTVIPKSTISCKGRLVSVSGGW